MTSRKLWIAISLLAFSAVIALLIIIEDTADVTQQDNAPYVPPITVIETELGTHQGSINSFAEIKPRWSADIKAHISGEIIEITQQAMSGESVQEKQTLVRIEDSQFKAALDQAEYTLAEAQLQLALEKKKSQRALQDWQRSGISDQPSDLVLNKPQQALAQHAVDAAESAVKAAKQDYSYTIIKAPFSGMIARRYVSIGQTINPGDPIVSLNETNQLDIEVSLSPKQWHNLSPNWQGAQVPITNAQGQSLALATIKRGGGFIDPLSRQYRVFLNITDATTSSALPGEFVHLSLPGKQVDNTLLIPESALTREGLVWYVDNDNRLRAFNSEVLFYQNDQLIVTVEPQLMNLSTLSVVLNPLASFIAGKQVKPMPLSHEQGN